MVGRPDWLQLTVGVGVIFTLFDSIARAWGSDRGQHGLAVGLVVIAATMAVDRAFFGYSASGRSSPRSDSDVRTRAEY